MNAPACERCGRRATRRVGAAVGFEIVGVPPGPVEFVGVYDPEVAEVLACRRHARRIVDERCSRYGYSVSERLDAPRRPKRSDLSTLELCTAVSRLGVFAWEDLIKRFPPKVVLAAIDRDTRRGFVSWGVAQRRPFLEPSGRAIVDL